MTINYQFGDADAQGATICAQAASLEAEHQAIVRDVLAAGDFWGGAGSARLLGVHHPTRLPGDMQTTGTNLASTDSAVASNWAQRISQQRW